MINTAQIALLFVVLLLTLLLLVLGVQVFFILRELRRTVSKANKVLDDTGTITQSVSGPISNLSNLVTGVKVGSALAKILSKKNKRDEDGQ
ncbi:hypothetical protein M1615_03110 [Patescibacteria group bacterium]|nr:hypothetical protein [Patescibacteria group bacterium]MCL5009991.1 hypothetical protein [Patescibacteria group bacterium]